MFRLSEANIIREFVYQTYILPAIKRGDSRVSFRAKDIHTKMDIKKSNYPNIIGALCRKIMVTKYEVKEIHRDPPSDGPNVVITYEL
jgi:hypothetical protein